MDIFLDYIDEFADELNETGNRTRWTSESLFNSIHSFPLSFLVLQILPKTSVNNGDCEIYAKRFKNSSNGTRIGFWIVVSSWDRTSTGTNGDGLTVAVVEVTVFVAVVAGISGAF